MTEEPDESKGRRNEGMGGLAKGLAIIEAYSDQRREMTVAGAAKAAGLSRASARRCLLTLADLGYLRRVGSSYFPTPRILRLGEAYFEAFSLAQLAQPHLDVARQKLNESVSLGVLESDQAVIVARAEVSRPVATYARLGVKLPVYASAIGRVLLSLKSDDEIDAYLSRAVIVAHSPKTVTDRARIRELILASRARGYSLSAEQFELGIFAMSVPVLNSKGIAVGALSISASIARIDPAQAEREFIPVLQDVSATLGREL